MFTAPGLRRETRYGVPAADLILYNRFYVLGYSFYFRQAKWALELVNPESIDVERADNFRPDYRVPEQFRADPADYQKSGFHRGHLVASANKLETEIQNSETFLLSNMSPQVPSFNSGIWKDLELAVRKLNDRKKILETYVISGPIFYFDQAVKVIGENDDNEVSLPIPHAYFKSVLTEDKRGSLKMWSFILDNRKTSKSIQSFLVPTKKVEKLSGLFLWEQLSGTKIEREKNRIRKIWC